MSVATRLALVSVALTLIVFSGPLLTNLPAWLLWMAIGFGAVTLLLAVAGWRARSASSGAQLVAEDCRRVEKAINEFVNVHLPRQPRGRSRSFAGWRGRAPDGEEAAVALYQREHRVWVLRVFDQAVVLRAVTPASRVQVEGESAAHIAMLPALFGGAAARLEQAYVPLAALVTAKRAPDLTRRCFDRSRCWAVHVH